MGVPRSKQKYKFVKKVSERREKSIRYEIKWEVFYGFPYLEITLSLLSFLLSKITIGEVVKPGIKGSKIGNSTE